MAKLEKKSFSRPVNEKLFEDFFSTEEERSGITPEPAKTMIPIEKIDSFPNHPFHVIYDASMQELIDSIRDRGVLDPILVRRIDDRYQLISGHRRKMACELCGLTEIPANIVDLDDDEATIAMVEANFHRPSILPSEKAFSYKMRYNAMKHQGKKVDSELTSDQIDQKSDTASQIANTTGESSIQVRRYIRLTYLIKDLLDMVDANRLGFVPAIEISYMPQEDQIILLRTIKMLNRYPTVKQAGELKNLSINSDHNLTEAEIISVFTGSPSRGMNKLTMSCKTLRTHIPASVTQDDYEAYILRALDYYREANRE